MHAALGPFTSSCWCRCRASNGTVEASVVADGGRQRVPVVVTGVYVGQVRAGGGNVAHLVLIAHFAISAAHPFCSRGRGADDVMD
jgi:hypothetical protein